MRLCSFLKPQEGTPASSLDATSHQGCKIFLALGINLLLWECQQLALPEDQRAGAEQ